MLLVKFVSKDAEELLIPIKSIPELTAMTMFLSNIFVFGYASDYGQIFRTEDPIGLSSYKVTKYLGPDQETIIAMPISTNVLMKMGFLYGSVICTDYRPLNNVQIAYWFGSAKKIYGLLTDPKDKSLWSINLNTKTFTDSSLVRCGDVNQTVILDLFKLESKDENHISLTATDGKIDIPLYIDLTGDFPIAEIRYEV